jgi:hypothetical protein
MLLCFINAVTKARVPIKKIVIPIQTCGSFNIGKAKQNIVKLPAFVITAINFVNFQPPLSITTRLSSPAKMIAMPAPTNQRVSIFM